ncbi:MAG: F0F1 ATP synthase subunit B [Gammaproteobacteria bacterium]|nr:F0F1 ATP synthase subunit B [Gammaproteobacteria bacterium]NNJ71636.1 F0F1 ATP synthase subunit B [Enterobacterales bacterium]
MDINLTIAGQTIAFIFFVWFCMKYVWPPLIGAIEERQAKIAQGLEASERGAKDLELAQEKATKYLAEAKAKAAEIVEQANKRHAQIVDGAKDDARDEAAKIKAGANAEIEQEVNRAREALRAQVATLALQGAEKILERSIDSKQHQDILDKLAKEI